MGTRAGLDKVEKRKFLTLPELELRPLGRPAGNQSLYRLRLRVMNNWNNMDWSGHGLSLGTIPTPTWRTDEDPENCQNIRHPGRDFNQESSGYETEVQPTLSSHVEIRWQSDLYKLINMAWSSGHQEKYFILATAKISQEIDRVQRSFVKGDGTTNVIRGYQSTELLKVQVTCPLTQR
jgi:hypothetical protein